MIKLLTSALLLIISLSCTAESLRCQGKLVKIGDTKADVLDKCGEPVISDNYCEPIVVVNQQQSLGETQEGLKTSTQNTQIIETCETIDLWTYKPGSGHFITHLYFSHGHLQQMKYGDRIP